MHEAAIAIVGATESLSSAAVRQRPGTRQFQRPTDNEIRAMDPLEIADLAWMTVDYVEAIDPPFGGDDILQHALSLLQRPETKSKATFERFRADLENRVNALSRIDALIAEARALQDVEDWDLSRRARADASLLRNGLVQRIMAIGRNSDHRDIQILIPYLEAADESIAHWARWAILDLLAKRDGRAERALLTGDEAAHALEEAYADEIERARRATRRGEESPDEAGL